jgi:predicted nucleotidyltransferase
MQKQDIDILQCYFTEQPYVIRAYLFGSYARNQETKDSDIDILVDLDAGIGLFQFANIQVQLMEKLQKNVDLVSTKGLSPYIGPYIHNDKILIYERKN